MECIGGYSCYRSTLHASYATIRSLQCIGSNSCDNMRINADYASYIDWTCHAYSSCRYAMLFHHDATSMYLNLDCAAPYSCRDIEVMVAAQNAVITCAAANYACSYSKIYCTSPTQTCNITCNTQASCSSLNVYAVQPSKTVHIMRGSEVFDASSITLNCGFVYERSCTLNANNSTNRLLCDTEHSCNSYVLDYS
eukprot:178034_1